MMNRKSLYAVFSVLVFLLVGVSVAGAVDVAPRISDREIIEKLSTLGAGQKALDQRLTDLRSEMKSGQEALRSEMKSGQEALRSEMKSGQEALDQRLADLRSEMKSGQEAIDKRFAFIEKLMIGLIGLIVSLIAFILWDRMATIRPIDARIKKVENELSSLDSSRLERMVQALRELSKTDDRLAGILRTFSLL